jgi:uncharacterized protein (DUF1697 family)
MPLYAVLLKGVNVSGKHLLPMARLREMAAELGWKDATTLLQSGNLVVTAEERTTGAVEKKLAAAVAAEFAFAPEVMARTVAEWKAVLERNPFGKETVDAPDRVLVGFLKQAARQGLETLPVGVVRDEELRLVGRELFAWFPGGVGKSKLDFGRVERHLGSAVTMRNWNTVRKIGGLLGVVRQIAD